MSDEQKRHVNWYGTGSSDSDVLREFNAPEIRGVDKTLEFLDAHLVNRTSPCPWLMPLSRVIMLYGREGSGKTTLLHAAAPDWTATRKSGFRYLDESVFADVNHFRLQHWNAGQFITWIDNTIQRVARMDVIKAPFDSKLIVIANVDKLHYIRAPEVVNALLRLLTIVRLFSDDKRVRVLLLCDENPGQFPRELQQLVDARHYVALPDPEARFEDIKWWISCFRDVAQKSPELKHLTWDLSLEPEDLEQSTHIIHTLVVASEGTTPREIANFMKRSFSGCRQPNPNGDTSYCAAWLESLLYTVDGAIKCIIGVNPASLNEALFKYAGIQSQEDSLIGAKTCFVRETPDMVQRTDKEDAGGEAAGDDDAGTRKRARANLQPSSVHQSIQERVAEQRKQAAEALKKTKERKREEERAGLANRGTSGVPAGWQ